jgi:hypothetical protein
LKYQLGRKDESVRTAILQTGCPKYVIPKATKNTRRTPVVWLFAEEDHPDEDENKEGEFDDGSLVRESKPHLGEAKESEDHI